MNDNPSRTPRPFRTVVTLPVQLSPSARPIDAGRLVNDIHDPELASVLALRERAERDRGGRFQIEGLRFLISAIDAGLPIETLVYSPADLTHPASRGMARDLISRRIPSIAVDSATLLSLANREDPQGLIAVTRQFTQPLAMFTPAAGLCWLAVDSIESPGNLGTLLRTAECVGAAGLIAVDEGALSPGGVDPYDPGCVRASMGAIFRQRLVRATFDDVRTWARRHGAAIVGTSPGAKRDYVHARYDRPVVLYLGSEKKGMAEERQHGCDLMVRIPMVGESDSLNVGIAGSIMLYELFNRSRLAQSRNRGRRS